MFQNALAIAKGIGFQIVKHSPTLCIAGGVICGVAALVSCVNDTPKALEQLKADKSDLEKIKEYATSMAEEIVKKREENGYTNKDYHHDLLIQVLHLVGHLFKNYWKTIALEIISIVLILSGFHIISVRYAGAVAAYKGLDEAFKAYRKRVSEKYGEDAERDIYWNRSPIKATIQNEDGTEKTVEGKTASGDNAGFDRVFDSSVSSHSMNPSVDFTFLRSQWRILQNKLDIGEVVTMNMVYKALGFKQVPEGQIVGWKPKTYISFGLPLDQAWDDESCIHWVEDEHGNVEPTFPLHFNHQGIILDSF